MKHVSKQVGRFLRDAFPQGTPNKKFVTVGAGQKIVREEKHVIIRRNPITWGIPCDEISFTEFWIRFEQHANKMPWDEFAASKGTYLPKARNIIHNAFLKSSTTHLMMLDSDILFPPDIVERLMAHNKPIIGGWYKDKGADDHHPVIYDFTSEDASGVIHWQHREKPGQGLEQVDAMGAGCWLMRRDVAEALGEEPYDLNSGGEDMLISRKLMRLGIPLFVDWSINCAHCGVGYV